MMRMKGHAIHDAAAYVPRELFDYWTKRDPIARFESYLVNVRNWLTPQENADLIAGVEAGLERDRDIAMKSPMPDPASALGGVYCDPTCHEIKPKYGMPRSRAKSARGGPKETDAAVHLK
jgi:TPP-dependent pyruvate/acetoin dehydrogenase alpha subunit